jgi:hypothetical protein
LGNEELHPDAQGTPESADHQTGETPDVRADSEPDNALQPEQQLEIDADTTDSAKEALEAMDQVDNNAQSLIENAIDTLLDAEDAVTSTQPESENEPDPSETKDDSLSSDDIDAMLDTLDSQTASDTDADSPPSDIDLSDALCDIEDMTDDELLSGIATELINDETKPLGEDIEQPVNIDAASSPEEAESEIDSAIEDAIDDIDEAAEEVAEEVAETLEESTHVEQNDEDETEAEPDGTLGDLDDMLAGIGDELINGDFETPDGELIESEDAGVHDASALLDQLNLDDLGLNEDKSSQESASEPQPESVAETNQAQPVATEDSTQPAQSGSASPSLDPAHVAVQQDQPSANNQNPAAAGMSTGKSAKPHAVNEHIDDDAPIPEVESIWQTAQRHAKHIGLLVLQQAKIHLTPIAAKGVLLINKPVQDRAPQLRDTIGFLALWTALLATILWFYIAFVRETPTPTPTTAPTRMLQQGEIIDPLRNPPAQP